MKAILMCAGKATRLMPLTRSLPKSLLQVNKKAIIEHTMETLSGIVKEVVIVVGHLKEKIIEKIGSSYGNITVQYVVQEKICGTGSAVYDCKKFFSVGEKFLVLNGDDLYSKKDIERLVSYELGILSAQVSDPSKYGVLKKDNNDYLVQIVEKPKIWLGNDINTGCYVLNHDIFEILKDTKPSERGEIELTTAVADLAKLMKVKVLAIEEYWLPVNYPGDYEYVSKYFAEQAT